MTIEVSDYFAMAYGPARIHGARAARWTLAKRIRDLAAGTKIGWRDRLAEWYGR